MDPGECENGEKPVDNSDREKIPVVGCSFLQSKIKYNAKLKQLSGIIKTVTQGGGTLIFCGYIGEAPASTPKPKKLLRFTDHPKKIPVLSDIPKKILGLLAYPKKLHVFIFFMSIDDILSHPYDLSFWWDVKSQFNQPTEHLTIQLVYVGTRK